MSESEGRGVPRDGSDASQVLERLKTIAITSAATIVAIHSTALAAGVDRSRQPQLTQIEDLPFLDPATIAAAGVTIATLGAYRLMRARNRERSPGDPSAKS